jgi:serine phosphatase RsbU (regulator of sigma subunit)
MFKRWEKIDIAIGILFVLTNLTYLLFDNAVFKIFLWILIIVVAVRLLYIIKKKLFWKVRNRLMFSGLFLIVTPLFFISLFFYVIFNILMAQYGLVIMQNILGERLTSTLESTSDYYLEMGREERVYNLRQMKKESWPFFNAVFYEKTGDRYKSYYSYPDDFGGDEITVGDFSGFFMVDGDIFYGTLKENETGAVLIAESVNQGYLDMISGITDFRVIYQDPNRNKIQEAIELTEDPELLNEEGVLPIPWMYKYQFLDFDGENNSKPRRRTGHFWLFLNMSKIFDKLTDMDSGSVQSDIKTAIYFMALIFGVLIIISFIIGVRSIRVITRSINLITRGTQRIRKGDFSFRIKTRSGDQLQYLGESFNEMAAGIDRLLIDEKEKQRLEEELRIARSIQLKLLPPDSFETEDFEIAAVNIPAAEIAGDYFDYFYDEGEYLSMLVADVSGKGTSAAFYMAELKGVINHLQKEVVSPSLLIDECHDSLKTSFDRVTFITMNMAKFILPEKKFLFARAGHTPALFYDAEKDECIELFPRGMAIGLVNFSRDKIDEIEVHYKKGDILFLFSDGLSEIMNDAEEMLGMDNLKRILSTNHHLSAEEIKQQFLDFSIRFSDTEINSDDLTFIILKVK